MQGKDKVIVSFADGSGSYAKALMRQELSFKQVGFNGRWVGINDYNHIGSPTHKGDKNSVPYAFKAHSIKKAMEYGRYVLWCDSVVYATKSIEPIFNHIKQHGYLFFDNIGFSIGDYTSDICLEKFSMTRQEAFKNKMIMACVMGFDTQNEQASEFLSEYIKLAQEGVTYCGSWSNENLQVSNDMRVKGHRHDQSVASCIIYKNGLSITRAQSTFMAYVAHKGIVEIADSVCLWSEGI